MNAHRKGLKTLAFAGKPRTETTIVKIQSTDLEPLQLDKRSQKSNSLLFRTAGIKNSTNSVNPQNTQNDG